MYIPLDSQMIIIKQTQITWSVPGGYRIGHINAIKCADYPVLHRLPFVASWTMLQPVVPLVRADHQNAMQSSRPFAASQVLDLSPVPVQILSR